MNELNIIPRGALEAATMRPLNWAFASLFSFVKNRFQMTLNVFFSSEG